MISSLNSLTAPQALHFMLPARIMCGIMDSRDVALQETAMGRLYSGNLAAFKAATNKLFQLDLAVIYDDWYDAYTRKDCIRLRIEDRSGNLIDTSTFYHHDEDVLFNMCTDWLNHMYDQLKDWK